MTTLTSSEKKKAVAYAEDTLQVHEAWATYGAELTALEEAQASLRRATTLARALRSQIEDRDYDVGVEVRAEHSKLSQAAFDRHHKDAIHVDPAARELRAKLVAAQTDIDLAEHEVKVLEHSLRGLQARMSELGGLLTFYAVNSPQPNTETTKPKGDTDG